jgi:SpoVK/Ycf46/Vps4 family AAA+-type ATPase
MGDGLLSSFIDIRLIVTTNAPVDSIDPAITRTGRLSERIHVGELSPQQAQEIYARLLGPDQVLSPGDCKNWMLSDVYSKAREKGWTEQKPEPQHGGGSEKTGQKPKGFAELHAEALQIENEFRDAVANLSLPPTLRHQP